MGLVQDKGIQAILFDNDGTLVDTQELILMSFRHATKEVFGASLPDEVMLKGVGTPLADQMYELADGDEALTRELLRIYREHNHAVHDQMVRTYEGIPELLARASELGLKMGVVTAKLHALAWHGLEVCQVSDYFGCLIGADDCPKHKPEPEPLWEACQRLDVDPAHCLYVGDSPYDMDAGNAAGCLTVAAQWGIFAPEVLAEHDPAITCATPSELKDML